MEDVKYKILLIEDDKLDQMAFQRLVREEKLPYDYTIAGSVRQAREILGSKQFDLVICDYSLGDGTAFDVFDSITDTATILATGAGDEELAVKAMKAGAYDYLTKDHARNYLKILPEIVKNAVRHKKAEDELKRYHDNLEELVRERTEQLAEEKELLSVTLSGMSDGIIVVDAEKRIMLFNTVAENLTGCNFKQVQGKPVDEILRVVSEQTKKPVKSPIDKVLNSGQTEFAVDCDAIIAKNGNEHPISATAAPIHKNDGIMVGVVMVIRDVSREREIDRIKAEFISSVSHELRTPLTSIKAYTETILRDQNMSEETKYEFLTIIDEESDRLANLIEGILEISRIEAATTRVVQEPVNIFSVTKQVSSTMEPLANKKNIQLKMNIDGELPEFKGDESKIQSMLTNLVNNAIKFTPEGGRVSVSIEHHAEELVIRVSDTGIGIPREELPKIFGRFYRVYRPGKQTQGTGLGLAIVEKIVTMHNGRIEVESKEGQGTTFTVFLPLKPEPIPEVATAN